MSADTIVPGNASGGMNSIALKPLTVDFHEPGFVSQLANENRGGDEKLNKMVPVNPQSLNRYSYTLNNPVLYVDPSGHAVSLNKDQAEKFAAVLDATINVLNDQRNGWDTRASNAIVGAALGALGSVIAPEALAILAGAGLSITSSFAIDTSKIDMNGNLAALEALTALKGTVGDFIKNGTATDQLTLWVSQETSDRRTGASFCNGTSCHYPTETTTRKYINASWGGQSRMKYNLSDELYRRFADATRLAEDRAGGSGPR